MAFEHDVYPHGDRDNTHTTQHRQGRVVSLSVTSGDSGVRVGIKHHGRYSSVEHVVGFPHARLRENTGEDQQNVAAPSEHLQQLIAQHHLHPDQWPILLDALQEEYPQLHDAIESHHAARRAAAESDATQYARALEAALTDLRSDTPLRVTRFAADGTRTVTTERLSEIAAKTKDTATR